MLDEGTGTRRIPGARQSRAVRSCTPGTGRRPRAVHPIENRLSGFVVPFRFFSVPACWAAPEGTFAAFLKSRSQTDQNQFTPLRRLVRPLKPAAAED